MRNLVIFVALTFVASCIDRINIAIPDISGKNIIVVDGVITNEQGPYKVVLTNPIKVDAAIAYSSYREQPVSVRSVTLSDDEGNSELLDETDKGVYQTSPNGIRGQVGHSYSIRIETFDGKIFESLPDKMEPVGAVDTIYYEMEAFQSEDPLSTHGYRVYFDAHDALGGNNYVRWKFTGTYFVETAPQNKLAGAPGPNNCPGLAPYPCSGYSLLNGRLKKGTYKFNDSTNMYDYQGYFECTCCRCWVTQPEDQPHISNKQLVSNGKFQKVEIGFVPINFYTFFEKYRVEVQQMSLSQAAFYYWRAFQTQKTASGSLFQPITGKIPSNISGTNNQSEVLGIFYASAVRRKQLYMVGKDLAHYIRTPVDCLGREGPIGETCINAFFPFATTVKPDDWVD